MNNDMKLYYDYTVSPLGRVFYNTVWHQLGDIQGQKILDFGSGFCFTSNYLARNNYVTAVEVNGDIMRAAKKDNAYTQLQGDINLVREMKDETFDVVICHLVLEFTDNPKEIIAELSRVLKKGGVMSVVRHNTNGRIIQAVVQDYDLPEADRLLDGAYSYSSAFGDIKYFNNNDVLNWLENRLNIKELYGVRALASLHGSDIQSREGWVEEMSKIERKLNSNKDFINIAYFNHLILQK